MCLSIPARVDEIDGNLAICTVGNSSYKASLELLTRGEVQVGDYVLIHTGFALQKLNEEDAMESLKTFNDFKTLNEQMDQEEKDNNTHLI
ncbi:MAG: HypC/HybG/HupF family hydrogenase formation chaperone [Bacteroidetes bacterium CG18_big_fil_WC_8_21_14_2_50_41_14]|nr:MAG: HypC/HybG/HupF family hydrogenase formation chaperone [Bacteroidetes bacterium CG18_big_fil_WC_8_21_14_2_50_41_14]PJB59620.1 MAG: HypC/HybG/HupF family hydrogenase formation chaperone [Bacteroidetes bacterium CG_4_9_14_3_um_filter_41_19]